MPRLLRRPIQLALLLLLVFSLTPAFAATSGTAAASPAALTARIDKLLTATYPAAEPGAAVLVIDHGQMLLRKGYGMANLELGVPIRPEMVFRLGSITKQFTAMGILKLVEAGKLALDDDITQYLPGFPTHGQKITVENLLTHTSGIKSYTELAEWRKEMREDLTVAQMIDLFKDQPADFAPGEKWNYSNSGYFLLGAILEKVTGQPYDVWMAANLFAPLGLTHTYYGHNAPIIPGRVEGYDGAAGHYENAAPLSMTQPYAAGSLVSSVDDLAKWDQALAAGTLVRKDLLARMFTPYRLHDGKPTGYGYGFTIWNWEGHRVTEHGGGINGFATDILRMPDDHSLVVVLSNNPGHDPGPSFLAARIASILIGKPLDDRKPIAVPTAVLDRYVGVYRIDDKTTRVVTRVGDQLITQRLPGGGKNEARASSPTDFYYDDTLDRVHFDVDAAGKVTDMVLEKVSGPEKAERTNEPIPVEKPTVEVAPELLAGLVGEYELAPGFTITVTAEGGHLFAQATAQPSFELFATASDEFFLKVVDAHVSFHRGPDGKATELVLHQNGDHVGKRVR